MRVDGKVGDGEGFPELTGRMEGWWVWVKDADLEIDMVQGGMG